MIITDLDHLVCSPDVRSIVGSSLASNSLFLNLNNKQLTLSLGDKELFQTTLSEAPSSIQISYQEAPGFEVSVSSTNDNGVLTTSSTVAGTVTQSSGLAPTPFWGLAFQFL